MVSEEAVKTAVAENPTYRVASDPKVQQLAKDDGLSYAYRFGCHMEGTPPGSACACPGVCTSVFEITGNRLTRERNEAAAQAVRDTLTAWEESGITHPSQIRAWLKDRAARLVEGPTNE